MRIHVCVFQENANKTTNIVLIGHIALSDISCGIVLLMSDMSIALSDISWALVGFIGHI